MTETTVRARKLRTRALMHYDKPHRCPAASGPGWYLIQTREEKYPACEGGYVPVHAMRDLYPRTWQFRTVSCPTCGITVLPHALIALTGYWWTRMLPSKIWWFVWKHLPTFRRRHGGR